MIRVTAKLLLILLGATFFAAAGYALHEEGKHSFAVKVCFTIGYAIVGVAAFL